MKFNVQRGQVEQMSQPEKDGSVFCQIGDSKAHLHPHLLGNIGNGETVIVAGRKKNDVLEPMVVKNLLRHKTTQVDSVGFMLIAMLGLFFTLLSLGFVVSSVNQTITLKSVLELIAATGFVVFFWYIRRFFFINDCVKEIDFFED